MERLLSQLPTLALDSTIGSLKGKIPNLHQILLGVSSGRVGHPRFSEFMLTCLQCCTDLNGANEVLAFMKGMLITIASYISFYLILFVARDLPLRSDHYSYCIQLALKDNNLFGAVAYLKEMMDKGINPDIEIIDKLVVASKDTGLESTFLQLKTKVMV